MNHQKTILLLTIMFGFIAWNPVAVEREKAKQYLSEYEFFKDRISDLKVVEGVIPYTLNSPLFSDYAWKKRFVQLPKGTKAIYNDSLVFDFPVGTILIKNFYFPLDFRKPEQAKRILETRLLIHEEEGWKALEYIWNDAQTDAQLEVAGGETQVNWVHYNGKKRSITYQFPNLNQCKSCHIRNGEMTPIGPSARQLNGDCYYDTYQNNQLIEWEKLNILESVPENETAIPRLAAWENPQSGNTDARARAYLDSNCGHCHNPNGPANTSGLFLHDAERDAKHLGIHKPPIAAGKAAANRQYDIVPGRPEQSILLYRMQSRDPGIMMPEVSRTQVHDEGISLIRAWIEGMKE